MNNNKLKYDIKTNQNNKENTLNTLDLQLFSSVSNPYTFTLDGNYSVNATIEQDLVSLYRYCILNILNFNTMTSIPQANLNYLQSGIYASDMDGMFRDCLKLTTIPKLNINTSQCTNMGYMFYECNSLTSLDISNFNTANVTDMGYMFYDCRSLTSLNVSNFDTSNVTDMGSMFHLCKALDSLNLSNFDTSKVTDMRNMFAWCESLTSLNISNFNTSKVTNMDYMFYYCSSLTTITGTIDMKSCTKYNNMFRNCTKLKGVKIKNPPEDFSSKSGLKSSQYTIVS